MIKSAGFRRLNMLLKLLRFVGYVITVMFCSYVACFAFSSTFVPHVSRRN